MRNGLQDEKYSGHTLSNLQFLIQLQLQTIAVVEDGTRDAMQARAVLRRLMEMEETLRDRQTAAGSPGSGDSQAA